MPGSTNIFYTYIYYDPSRENEPIYVGKGNKNRAYQHLKRIDRHPFVQRLQSMQKNNVKPVIKIINALDESHAFLLEECLIDILGRKDLGKGTLLNLTDGGEGPSGYIHTDDHKLMAKGIGLKNVELNRGIFSLTKEDRLKASSLGGKISAELGMGFKAGHASRAGKIGGITGGEYAKINHTGIHSLSKEKNMIRIYNSQITQAVRSGKASTVENNKLTAWPLMGETNNV